jgi:hypothetical protein
LGRATEPSPQKPAVPPVQTPVATQESTSVTIYLVRWPAQGEPRLEPVKRDVPKGRSDADPSVMKSCLEALVAGPTPEERAAGLSAPLPRSTKVLSVKVDGTTASVDFSREIITRASAEAAVSGTGEALALESIRRTMAGFPTLTRVKLLVEGRSRGELDGRLIEDFWGHVGLPEYLVLASQPGPEAVQSVGKPADGMAIKSVRWSSDFSKFRLVIDIENADGTRASQCPVVRCSLSASARVLSIEVNGIRAVRDPRLVPGKPLTISSGPAVSITRQAGERTGDDQLVSLDLALDPSRSYTYKLFSLVDPVRAVIDVFPN